MPVEGVTVNSNYGWRTDPFTGEKSLHKGVDFACIGQVTPIHAAQAGKVIYSQYQVNSDGTEGYGNLVMIRHSDQLITAYAHMSSLHVDVGDTVEQGEKVGVCGTTGNSTGPHLHFETKKKLWSGHMNPMKVLGLGGSS